MFCAKDGILVTFAIHTLPPMTMALATALPLAIAFALEAPSQID